MTASVPQLRLTFRITLVTITDTLLAIPLTNPPPFNHLNGGRSARVGVVFVRTINIHSRHAHRQGWQMHKYNARGWERRSSAQRDDEMRCTTADEE